MLALVCVGDRSRETFCGHIPKECAEEWRRGHSGLVGQHIGLFMASFRAEATAREHRAGAVTNLREEICVGFGGVGLC